MRALVIANVHTTVALRKVTSQVAAIVQDAGHLDYPIFATAIEQEMSWLRHLCASHSVPAQRNVVSSRPLYHDLLTFH